MCSQVSWASAVPKLLSLVVHVYVSVVSTVQAQNGHSDMETYQSGTSHGLEVLAFSVGDGPVYKAGRIPSLRHPRLYQEAEAKKPG